MSSEGMSNECVPHSNISAVCFVIQLSRTFDGVINMTFISKIKFRISKFAFLSIVLLLVISSTFLLTIMKADEEQFKEKINLKINLKSENIQIEFKFWNNIEACREKQVYYKLLSSFLKQKINDK